MNVFDPALGATYAEIGTLARSMHKSQGMARLLALPGPRRALPARGGRRLRRERPPFASGARLSPRRRVGTLRPTSAVPPPPAVGFFEKFSSRR